LKLKIVLSGTTWGRSNHSILTRESISGRGLRKKGTPYYGEEREN